VRHDLPSATVTFLFTDIEGSTERAVRLYGAADGLMKTMEAPLWGLDQLIVEQHVAPAGEGLTDDLRRVLEKGAAMSVDEAVAYALEEA